MRRGKSHQARRDARQGKHEKGMFAPESQVKIPQVGLVPWARTNGIVPGIPSDEERELMEHAARANYLQIRHRFFPDWPGACDIVFEEIRSGDTVGTSYGWKADVPARYLKDN